VLNYLKYINDELGGLQYKEPGGQQSTVKLDLIWEDAQYNAAKQTTIYKRHKNAGVKMMYMVAGSMPEVTLEMLTADRMPVVYNLVSARAPFEKRPQYAIAEEGSYTGMTVSAMQWIKKNWKESRPPRIVQFTVDSQAGRAEYPGTVPRYATETGVEWLGFEWIPAAATDTSIELSRARANGADWILINHVPAVTTLMMKDALRMGLRDKFNYFVVLAYAFDESLLRFGAEMFEGFAGHMTTALPTENVPGVATARKTAQKYSYGEVTTTYLKGQVAGMAMASAIKAALEKVGYAKLTSDDINNALHSFDNLDMQGLSPPVTVDPNYPMLNPYMRVGKVEGGKFKVTSDWFELPKVELK